MLVVSLLLALVTASSLVAQVTVTAPTELRSAPRGAAIATVRPGTEVRVRERRGALSRITLEGFLHRDLIGGRRDSFALSVRAPSGARLRQSPSPDSRPVATLRDGMGLTEVSRAGDWVRVRRVGWISTSRLRREPELETREQASGSVETKQQPPPPRAPDVPIGSALTPTRHASIRLAPAGDSIGGVRPGAVLVPLARERDWVRVRVEGWVRESELQSVDSTVQTRLSAADLRADPAGTRGVVVRWNVQVLSPIQRADPLRRELAENEPYVIARGPDAESALLYLAIPPSMVDAVASIAPLTGVVITGRVRTGRSSPVGVPILDLVSIVRR
jgi:SH3-like domain-containing protein